jgi:hypothetical protein
MKFWRLMLVMAWYTLTRQWRKRDAIDERLSNYIAGRQQQGTWPTGGPL